MPDEMVARVRRCMAILPKLLYLVRHGSPRVASDLGPMVCAFVLLAEELV